MAHSQQVIYWQWDVQLTEGTLQCVVAPLCRLVKGQNLAIKRQALCTLVSVRW